MPGATICTLGDLIDNHHGVNAWCLDGRGALWRESLPVGPRVVFAARAWVLTEFLLVASLVTAPRTITPELSSRSSRAARLFIGHRQSRVPFG